MRSPRHDEKRGCVVVAFVFSNKEALVYQVYDLSLVGDDAMRWRFKMKDFDESADGGRRLNADLARLRREHGCDHLLLEVGFGG